MIMSVVLGAACFAAGCAFGAMLTLTYPAAARMRGRGREPWRPD